MSFHRLDAGDSTLVFDCRDALLDVCYLGRRLPAALNLEEISLLTAAPTPHGELDCELRTEGFPGEDGHSPGQAALRLRRDGHALLNQLRVADCSSSGEVFHCTLEDRQAGVEIRLTLCATASGVFSSESAIVNSAKEGLLEVDWLAALHLPLPALYSEVERYGGFWANEMLAERIPLGQFALDTSSQRGRCSHQSFPTLICGETGFSHEKQRVLLTTLAWSGNHRLRVEPAITGGHSLQAGVVLQGGEVRLAPGEQWQGPKALFALSNGGLNDIRRQFKRYWFDQKAYSEPPERPVHFNSWESSYFEHDVHSSLKLIDEAHDLGAERFVLDDGWMEGRSGIGVGLGDWLPCPRRYPEGLGPLARHARKLGMSFGVWIEPEMLTPDSSVAAEHPDWIIAAAAYPGVSGRQQYLLNLCLSEVREHILQCIERLIQDCDPDYLKWDMNRDYAQVGFGGSATPEAMTRAWYQLLSELRLRHPRVVIESCAAGGARNDAGALTHADRLWPSDSMDPLQRFALMKHISCVFPPALLGSHVGAAPSSTTGATLPLSTRCLVALLGHMGLELDPKTLDASERDTIRRWVAFFKRERDRLARSDFYYLDGLEPGLDSLLVYSREDTRCLLFILRSAYPTQAQPPVVALPSCVRGSTFHLELLNPEDADFVQQDIEWHRGGAVTVSGDTLHLAGLRLPFLRAGHAALIQITPTS
ncbi:alpha-galactosidase [Congregibacter litoralis]|uniref:alpha-galactosidase n=1 Tax=Congregibacter litoralis KT71 TaxID=314285 RepID=A4AD85_9GAMM|nr:alpha-galactosidase [Congregibacter litoralis]EAQ96009.1 Alpha-galactosidase [Congregibacter litoralis KT71]